MALESLDATITRIFWQGPDQWDPAGMPKVIARTHQGSKIIGKMWRPVEDSPYRLWGAWRQQKPRNGYPAEMAFEFLHSQVLCDRSEAGIVQFLRNHIDGLGPRLASRLVDEFSEDTLDILRSEPERALSVKGITEAVVQSIRDHFENQLSFDPAAYARLVDLFASADVIVPQKVVLKLLEFWGSDAPAKVVESPYLLLALPRMGWKTVDGFAQSLAVGYDLKGLPRQRAAILEALERISDEGHTHAGRVDLEAGAFALLGYCPAKEAWDGLIERAMLWTDGESYALPALVAAEEEVAERLRVIADQARLLEFELESDRLNEDQQQVLRVIQDHGVAILAGPPGVGKSFLTAEIVKSLIQNQISRIIVTAPTGKASKRAKELIDATVPGNGIPCSTIHKALGVVPSGEPEGVPAEDARVGRGRQAFGFAHGPDNPLKVDYLICDEASMVDASLMASLLSALPPGCRVLFVGDQNQLPSVGPGSVLRDMMEAGVPTALLTKIVRSDGGGRVVRACHAIKDGRVPEPAPAPPRLPTENWVHIEESDPARMAEFIVDLCRPYASFPDPVWDIQVVSAQHDKPGFGCNNLNRLLSAKLNVRHPSRDGGGGDGFGNGTVGEPGTETKVESDADAAAADAFEPVFLAGDKVIRRKNGPVDRMIPISEAEAKAGLRHTDWTWRGQSYRFAETAVVNGDMGIVEDVIPTPRGAQVVVRFRNPERLCRIPYGECHLQRAYAITCHGAQGSGFPMVIVPVSRQFYWDARTGTGLWCRELLYTAISRAEKVLITVGEEEAIRAAVGRRTLHKRRTRLKDLIAGAREHASNRAE